jgi:NAD(P)H-nitrite reductase large subunit
MNENDIILCRCEDVTLGDVRRMLAAGYVTVEDLKRQLRIGMGPCQGTTCGALLQREIARFLSIRIEDVPAQTPRPFTTGVPLKAIAEAADDEE